MFLSTFLGFILAILAVLSLQIQVECLHPLILSSSALPFSIPLLIFSTLLLSLPLAFSGRKIIGYTIPAGIQIFISYLIVFSGYTLLLRVQGFSLTFWDGQTKQVMCLLPALIYFVSWLYSIKGIFSVKEYLPLAIVASLLLISSLYNPTSIMVSGVDWHLILLPTGTTSSTIVASLLVFACGIIGVRPPARSRTGKVATILTFTPTLFLTASESLITKRATSILGYCDHLIHSAFPLHFNVFIFLSVTALLAGVTLSSNKRTERILLASCIAFTFLYPPLYRLFSQPLSPIAVEPAPLVWLSVAIAAFVLLRSSFPKVFPMLLLFLLIVTLLYPSTLLSSSSSIPLSLSIDLDDRIDPSILEMKGIPGPIHVILRLPYISDAIVERLNETSYFKISYYNGEPAVYKNLSLIYGVLDASTSNWKNLVRNLVKEFNLKYILLNRNPSETPLLDISPQVYSVDADILHALNITGRGVTVAIIDSGINDADPEIAGKSEGRILYQVNLITGEEGDPLLVGELTPTCRKYHGTFVARTIAGTRGIAPHANIIDLKVQLEMGEMYYDTSLRVVEAIEWCIRHKDKFNISVINLSMGNREGTGGIIDEAVNKAVLAGITVVAAAGTWLNPAENHINSISTPGTASLAITVGATQSYDNDVLAYLPASSIGPGRLAPKPDLVAPGPYTSGSTPIVAGVAVLLHQVAAELNIPQGIRGFIVKQALIQGAACHDLGSLGWDIFYGYGKVNALSSYLMLKSIS